MGGNDIVQILPDGARNQIGESNPAKRSDTRRKISQALTGKPHPWSLGEHNVAKRDDVKRKISEALKGMPHPWNVGEKQRKAGRANKGKKRPDITGKNSYWHSRPGFREKVVAAMQGIPQSAEHIKKLSAIRKGKRPKSFEALQRVVHSPEFRQKQRVRGAIRVATMQKKNTGIELKIQGLLNQNGIPFFTHVPIMYYNADIVLADAKVAIFCDGCYWHGCKVCNKAGRKMKPTDKSAISYLSNRGWRVVRLWEHEINNGLDACQEKILNAINEASPMESLWIYMQGAEL